MEVWELKLYSYPSAGGLKKIYIYPTRTVMMRTAEVRFAFEYKNLNQEIVLTGMRYVH